MSSPEGICDDNLCFYDHYGSYEMKIFPLPKKKKPTPLTSCHRQFAFVFIIQNPPFATKFFSNINLNLCLNVRLSTIESSKLRDLSEGKLGFILGKLRIAHWTPLH